MIMSFPALPTITSSPGVPTIVPEPSIVAGNPMQESSSCAEAADTATKLSAAHSATGSQTFLKGAPLRFDCPPLNARKLTSPLRPFPVRFEPSASRDAAQRRDLVGHLADGSQFAASRL